MSEALACFSFLRDQAPLWAAEVAELDKHVAARQAEMAQLPSRFSKPKLKKSGSNESIRPNREVEEVDAYPYQDVAVESRGSTESPVSIRYGLMLGGTHTDASSAPARQQEKAPSTDMDRLPRKRRTASILSNATAPPKYRSRSMIIVYYDSIVQAAFEQLVRHITTAKNRVRKAKMAARVQMISSFEDGDEDDDDNDDDDDDDDDDCEYNEMNGELPPIAARRTSARWRETSPAIFRSARTMTAAVSASTPLQNGAAASKSATPNLDDGFEEVDELLDEAQGHCENGAHQFLRDGDCDGHTESATKSFANLVELSIREIARLEEKERKAQRRASRRRTRELRREGSGVGFAEMTFSKVAEPVHPAVMGGPIEVDDGVDGEEEMEVPTVRSARHRGMARPHQVTT